MIRTTIVMLGIAAGLPVSAYGDIILSIENAPSSYTPGTPFSFDVRMQGAVDLNLFSIDLVMQATSGTPGISFFFDDTQTFQHPTEYVFGVSGVNPDGFFAVAGVDGATATLNLSDLLDIGEQVDTSPGVNEFIAEVVAQTTADAGDLSLGFDTAFLELLNDAGEFIPPLQDPADPFAPDFTNLTLQAPAPVAPSGVNPIPEPTSIAVWSVILITGIISIIKAHRARKQVSSCLR